MAEDHRFDHSIRWLARLGVGKRFVELFRTRQVKSDLVPGAVRDWQGSDGEGLVLMGPTGTGKTVSAIYAAWRMWYQDPVLVDSDATFASAVSVSRHIFSRDRWLTDVAARAALLIVDDWGVDSDHDWVRSEMDWLVDARWRNLRPTIVTTNLRPTDGTGSFSRSYPRALSRLGTIVEMPGKDQRRT